MKREKNTSPGKASLFLSKLFHNKAVIVYALAILLCVASFFLPGIVLGIRDRALANSDETVPVDEVQLSLLSELSTAQQLALVGDPGATVVHVSAGRHLTVEEARDHADSIARSMSLLDKGVSEFEVALTPQLLVAADNSALLTWTAQYTSDSRDVTIIFADETGNCLAFRQSTYPHGKAALSGAGVGGETQSTAPAGEGAAGSAVVSGGKYTETFNDPKSMDGYEGLITRILSPLGVQFGEIAITSEESVSAIIPYDNTYYSMPVSIHSVEQDGYTYALHINVNM